jgi:hypothetical protein
MGGRRETADDRHRQEGAHDSDAGYQDRGTARAEAFVADRAPPPNRATHIQQARGKRLPGGFIGLAVF